MNYKNYIPHLHTKERPEGYPVRRMPGSNRWVQVGLGGLGIHATRAGATGVSVMDLTEIDLTTLPSQIATDGGGNNFSSVPVTPLLLLGLAAVFLMSR